MVYEDADLEIYSEYACNDSKQNLRDLLLDSDTQGSFNWNAKNIQKK